MFVLADDKTDKFVTLFYERPMGRTGASELVKGQLQAKVNEQAARIAYLERRVGDLKVIITEICDHHEIPRPDLRFRHYVPLSVTRRHFAESVVQEDDDTEPQNGGLTQKLLGEMVVNQGRKSRRYSEQTKSLYATVFLRSPSAYKALATVLPIPQPRTLMRLSAGPLRDIQERVQSPERAREALLEFRSRFPSDDPILGVLSVDACSHSDYFAKEEPTALAQAVQLEVFLAKFRPPGLEFPRKPNNYCFVYYFQPLDPRMPCLPLHICSEPSGKAQMKHVKVMDDLVDICQDLGFTVIMKCSDGDNEYYTETRKSYKSITDICEKFDDVELVAQLGLEILDGLTLFGADMLHILKNARTRLLTGVVSPNVTQPRRLDLAEIKKILDVPKECWENSDLNKMVDALPIAMFTFQNVWALYNAGLEREAMYFLMFTLFHSFFRADCDFVTRIGLGTQFIRYARMYIDYVAWTTKNGTCMCGEVRRKGGSITLFTECHLQRMIVTVTVVMAILLVQPDGDVIALDRCSTHPLENFFGLLRVFCSFKHTYTNILDKIARTQYIRQISHELGLSSKVNTRLNIAGEKVEIQKKKTGFLDADYSPGMMYLIDSVYAIHILKVDVPFADVLRTMNVFFRKAGAIRTLEARTQGKYSGIQILNRLIANSRGIKQEETEQ